MLFGISAIIEIAIGLFYNFLLIGKLNDSRKYNRWYNLDHLIIIKQKSKKHCSFGGIALLLVVVYIIFEN